MTYQCLKLGIHLIFFTASFNIVYLVCIFKLFFLTVDFVTVSLVVTLTQFLYPNLSPRCVDLETNKPVEPDGP
jgi:hypothetical protein